MQRKNSTCFDDETINIYEILLAMKKRIWLISIITLTIFILFAAYSKLAVNVYKANNMLIINKDIEINPMNETGDIRLILSSLAEMPMEEQAKLLDLKEQNMRFVKKIVISEIQKSSSLKIEIDILNRELAPSVMKAITDYVNNLPYILEKIALKKKIVKKAIKEIKKMVDNPALYMKLPHDTVISQMLSSIYHIRDRDTNLTYILEELKRGDFVKLAKATHIPSRPYKPARLKVMLLGLLVGAFLGLFNALMLEWIYSARRDYETR